ncbi:D-glycero-beta-D-manno-heptose-7-phosphate kinase [Rhodospirillaceae bacterium KN72]|uniref:Bifunctional protein HldE n=1 Tax=Pacificispira spongiicola TaxID=2729598 RepID=A0A7Y0E0Z4_9PROT|nr:D-glycero-beta-D-manno-heptose-7-phosphate kinase [Pacificispira spongiicola]NMM45244.1 D-glycero-beta-D-manno-heptose-7-phosphate kinase [Pacificispira spongiicola]
MTKSDLAATLDRMGEALVLCVGDLMLDRFVEGAVERISPEAPIPILSVGRERTALGGAANVARNIAALGARCRLIGTVGKDPTANEIEALIAELPGIEPVTIAAADRPTAVKTRYMAGRHQLLRADREKTGPLPQAEAEALKGAALAALSGVGALVLSDYGKGVLSNDLIAELIAAAKVAGIPVLVDPKGRDFSKYRGADLVTPNRQELALASGLPTEGDDAVLAACRSVAETCGLGGVLATRSEQGMTLYRCAADGAEQVDHLPARAREVFDVAGAGDTVVATLAAGFAAGLSALDAAALANRAAGIVVAKTGTAVAYPSEILSDSHEETFEAGEAKVATLDGALDRVAVWRRDGKSVGFTNGCFDLLHPGHVSLISQARAACDRLIVGLNSDASVARLKGPERPVQPESARANVLAALGDVDMVVIFGEDTPLSLIRSLQPDVLIKGADYTKDQVVGASDVESWGGKVVLAQLVDGQSTTRTISRMTGR